MRLAIKLHFLITMAVMFIMVAIMCLYFKIPENTPLQLFVAFALFYAFISLGLYIIACDFNSDWFDTQEELRLKIQEYRKSIAGVREIEAIIGEHEAVKFYKENKENLDDKE